VRSCNMDPNSRAKSAHVAAKTYRDLIAWQVSMQLVAETYRLAAGLPAIERYGLASQLRRAAVSIPLNVAEGFGRRSRRDFSRFLTIASASLREVQTLIEVVPMLGYKGLDALDGASNLANRTGFLLHRLRKTLPDAP
jgi:four helix bundle protein